MLFSLSSIIFNVSTLQTTIAQSNEQFIWQLAYWQDYKTACTILTDRDTAPSNTDIHNTCGDVVYSLWITTPPCANPLEQEKSENPCSGLFLRRAGRATPDTQSGVQKPKPGTLSILQLQFNVDTVVCQPGFACDQKAEILLSETSNDTNIYQLIRIRIGSYEGQCAPTQCLIQLPETSEHGESLEYWVMDTSGEQGTHYWLKFRQLPIAGSVPQQYRYDLISSAYPTSAAYGALIWNIFPSSVFEMDKSLEKPFNADFLITTNRLDILAGKLIYQGKVNAETCPSNGLNSDLSANACGLEVTAQAVYEYQNQYNQQLVDAGLRYHMPPRIVKGIIAAESQFWPHSDVAHEYGLGMMTEKGADMLLRSNTQYYNALCANVFEKNANRCVAGFSELPAGDQTILRGAALRKIGTTEEIDLLTATLKASAIQVGQIVTNVTNLPPANVTTYADLWKFSAANYYSGSGCIYNAMLTTFTVLQPLIWDNVSYYMSGECSHAVAYVNRVFSLGR